MGCCGGRWLNDPTFYGLVAGHITTTDTPSYSDSGGDPQYGIAAAAWGPAGRITNIAHSNAVALTNGLVGYWTFDGGVTSWKTDTTQDVSGNGNTGSLVSMSTSSSPIAGKIGQALNFNGNGYIDAGSPTSLDDLTLAKPITFSFWINPFAQDDIIMGKNDDNAVNAGFWIENRINPPGVGVAGLRLVIERATINLRAGAASPSNGVWTHVVMTYRGDLTAANTKIYYNGVLQTLTTSDDGSGSQGSDAAETFYIAKDRPAASDAPANNKFNGKLDDVRIYNRALSSQDIKQLYNLGSANAGHSNTAISNGLIGYWTFDGGVTSWKTDTTQDVSGNGNIGTLVSMSTTTSPAAGKIGQALNFNGSSNYIDIGDIYDGDTLTLSAWVNPNAYSAVQNNILLKRNTVGTANTQNNHWELALNPDGSFGLVAWDSGNSLIVNADSSVGAVPLNKWTHVVATIPPGSGTINLYANGALVGSGAKTGVIGTTGGSSIQIGARSANDNARWFSGKIDDARLYNRALSPSEVKQLSKLGTARI